MTRRKGRHVLRTLAVLVVILLLVSVAGLFAYDRYLRETHPLKYTNYVEQYAEEYSIPKTLVYAVIKTESGFRSDAVSNVGARGLMQIMEETFDWIKFKLGDDEAEYYDMYDPKTNIRYGCYLLGFLLDEFGEIDVAVAAYHAGRGNVNSWLSDKRYSLDGIHLEHIPIADTAHYVNKINKAIDNYIRLYNI